MSDIKVCAHCTSRTEPGDIKICAHSAQAGLSPALKTESPDVETPGLLVKALISSFFMQTWIVHETFLTSVRHKYSRKKAYEQVI
jgi:hypothetical protein